MSAGNTAALAAARAARDHSKPVERLDPIEKARRNPKSRALAIVAKCWDCVGADADPGTRDRIRTCTSRATCPLWPLRPYQTGDDDDSE
jgi:hypothetical protein